MIINHMINSNQRLYSTIQIDYAGLYYCWTSKTEKKKVYILLFKCAWSTHLNMEITISADTKNFLQAFQNHVYEHGFFYSPKRCRQ